MWGTRSISHGDLEDPGLNTKDIHADQIKPSNIKLAHANFHKRENTRKWL